MGVPRHFRRLGGQQVADLLVVYLHQGHVEAVLHLRLAEARDVEELAQRAVVHATAALRALHGERLAGSSLPVGKDADVVAVHHAGHHRRCLVVDGLLAGVHPKDAVEAVLLVLYLLRLVCVCAVADHGNGVGGVVHLGADGAVNRLARGVQHGAHAAEDANGAAEVDQLIVQLLALGMLCVELRLQALCLCEHLFRELGDLRLVHVTCLFCVLERLALVGCAHEGSLLGAEHLSDGDLNPLEESIQLGRLLAQAAVLCVHLGVIQRLGQLLFQLRDT
mmetsp:Transcript_2713/g.7163  ORF Transcript_2713/g.7163 Transcript_2713/m.7163 type:complete len:278 (+) Transcript_2713:1778-2611(+)